MRELRQRAELIVRILCLILVGVVAYELKEMAVGWNPFHGVTVPDLPVLASDTNAAPAGSHKTNLVASVSPKDTNNPSKNLSTNSTAKVAAPNSNSNSVAVQPANGSNLVVHVNSPSATSNATVVTGTNALTNAIASTGSNQIGTNIASVVPTSQGTNHHHSVAAAAGGMNSGDMPPQAMMAGGAPPMFGMPGMMGGGLIHSSLEGNAARICRPPCDPESARSRTVKSLRR